MNQYSVKPDGTLSEKYPASINTRPKSEVSGCGEQGMLQTVIACHLEPSGTVIVYSSGYTQNDKWRWQIPGIFTGGALLNKSLKDPVQK